MINSPHLEATMTHVRDHPELHNQSWFFTKTDVGEAMCFGARACALEGMEQVAKNTNSALVYTATGSRPARVVAQELLGLTKDQADVLFHPANTRVMLEQIVKDLSNSGTVFGDWEHYYDLVS